MLQEKIVVRRKKIGEISDRFCKNRVVLHSLLQIQVIKWSVQKELHMVNEFNKTSKKHKI